MPRPKDQEPVETKGHLGDDSKRFNHPAFGQIRASRVQGTTALYGSDFLHHAFVTIAISRSELNRDLSHDWHFGAEELIEVNLSEAQWASFVSTLNSGSGTPCTIDHIDGVLMPGIPLRRNIDVVEQELNDTLKAARKAVADTFAAMDSDIGQSLSGTKRAKLLEHVQKLQRLIDDHLPFMAKSFAKHMETTVEKAKIEVNAYVQNAVVRAGLKALQGESVAPLELTSGARPDGD